MRPILIIAGFAVIAACVMVATYYNGDAPSPYVIGPSNAQVGDLVVLTAEDQDDTTTAAKYAWSVVPSTVQKRLMEGDKVAVLVFDEPGEYAIVLATASGADLKQEVHYISVTGDEPSPEPGPSPTPEPEPEPDPTPEPDSEWATWVYNLAIETVVDSNRSEQAKLLSEQLQTVSAKIAANAIKTPREARVELRAANNRALGINASAWIEFSLRLSSHLAELSDKGELSTMRQYQEIYLGIAEGLSRVATKKKRWVCTKEGCYLQ